MNLGGKYAAARGSGNRRPPPGWGLGLPVRREWTIEVPAPVEEPPIELPEPQTESERPPEEVPA